MTTYAQAQVRQQVHPWTTVVMCLAVSLVMAAVAALYAAVPSLARDTGAGDTAVTWIVDAYTLVLAALLLPAGALGDRFGRRGALLAGLAIFTAGCGLPLLLDATPWLIGSRALTGLGAALLMPATLSIITASLPPHRRRMGIGVWAGAAGFGGFLGVVAAGVLLRYFTWHAVFGFLAASAALVFVAALTVPPVRSLERPRLDLPGTLLSALGLTAVVFGIIEAPDQGWASPLVLGCLAGGLVLLVAFTVVELHTAEPLLDVRLFADRGFGGGALSLTMQFFAAFGVLYVLSQYLQFVLGYSAMGTGLAMLPVGALLLPLAVLAPLLAARWGMRLVVCSGFALLAVAMVAMAWVGTGAAYWQVAIGIALFGAGLGLSSTPATAAIMDNVPEARHGVASAVNDATRETGAALGIALLGTLLSTGYRGDMATVADRLPSPMRERVTDSIASALELAPSLGPAGARLADSARAAFVSGMREAYLLLAVLLAVTAVALLRWAPRDGGGSHRGAE